jgi:hypothetical protein
MRSHYPPTLYIIYNASSTLLGKLSYVRRKCTSSNSDPACAACELTHGPSLSLTESAEWRKAKQRIKGVAVKQVHTDEMPENLRSWMEWKGVKPPAVVVGLWDEREEGFFELMGREDLARVRRSLPEFLELLERRAREKDVEDLHVEKEEVVEQKGKATL